MWKGPPLHHTAHLIARNRLQSTMWAARFCSPGPCSVGVLSARPRVVSFSAGMPHGRLLLTREGRCAHSPNTNAEILSQSCNNAPDS